MTWLRGQATQSTIADKLNKLCAGEVADDLGNTAAVGDRWVRPIAGQDWLVAPASQKVALPSMDYRAGYFAHSSTLRADEFGDTFLRQTSVAALGGVPGAPTRARIYARVVQANAVAGNYSTAQVAVGVWNADTDVIVSGVGNFTPAADGTITLPAAYGNCTLKVGAPATGILTTFGAGNTNYQFHRVWTTTYPGGIDFWPMACRRYPGESTVFTVNPPGADGTDWVRDVLVPIGTTATSNSDGARPSGGYSYGLGIKTNTALTGAVYTGSWNVWAMSIRLALVGTGTLNATLNAAWAQYPVDSVYRRVNGRVITQWVRMFNGAPLASSVVQYWLSVKSDRITVVLNGDPGVGGVLSCASLYKFTPDDAAVDLFPWASTGFVNTYTSDQSNEAAFAPTRFFPLIAEQAAANGYKMPTGRDWSTGWGRTDCAMPTSTSQYLIDDTQGGEGGGGNGTGQGMGYTVMALPNAGYTLPPLPNMGAIGLNSSSNYGLAQAFPMAETKPHPGDAKWHLYGHVYYDQFGTSTSTLQAVDDLQYRGKLTDKFFYIPGLGWSSGDELTDTATGKTYFLVAPDWAGSGMGRFRYTTGQYSGGVAIEEA